MFTYTRYALIAHLDGYAIVPRDEYEQLTTQKETVKLKYKEYVRKLVDENSSGLFDCEKELIVNAVTDIVQRCHLNK